MSRETDEMERDLKGFPDYKEEELHTAQMDYNEELQLEQAKDIVDFNDFLQIKKKQLDSRIEEYNVVIDGILSDYPQRIIEQFYYKEE